eukprot:s1452_g8.t1
MSRPLHPKGVELVMDSTKLWGDLDRNYDSANSTEDYVHRIGRTGRAGQKGRSLTFLTRSGEDAFKAVGMAAVMEKAGCPIPADMQELVERIQRRQQQAKLRDQKWEDLPKVLMVAEKPSVAKFVAESLCGNARLGTRKGQSRAVQVFEFVGWFPPAQQKCRILQTSTIGHIFGLDFENGRLQPADLFYANVKKTVEASVAKNRIVEHLQELGKQAEYLALWLDCDREGENICYEVMSLCGSIPEENVYRAHFSALTVPEIKTAFSNLGRPDKHLAMAVDARQELDLKIGVAFTRLMTRTFLNYAKEKFRVWDQTCLSYGPCQTPTLWFCVERHKEIEKFTRQDVFTPTVTVNIEDYPVELSWLGSNDGRSSSSTFDEAQARQLEQRLQAAGTATFSKIDSTRKHARRPVGLNTVQMLKACSSRLGMSPAETMRVAEGLYSAGYISYPRTETTKYSQTFDLSAALREQAAHPMWGRTVQKILSNRQLRAPASGTDKGDHPPITPIKAAHKEEFSKGKEWRLYEYVTRHFIASLMEDAAYDEISYVFDVAGEQFAFTYHYVVERGFFYATPWKPRDMKLEEIDWDMPEMAQGQQFKVDEVTLTRDTTKPPDYLKLGRTVQTLDLFRFSDAAAFATNQESELVTLMDKNGIGTDASIPQHVQNVVDRHYVMICGPGGDGQRGEVISKGRGKGRKGKGKGKMVKGEDGRPASRHMVPTPMGLSLLAAFEELDPQLCRPPIRAFMEKQVAQIADGVLEKSEVTAQNLDLFYSKFTKFSENISRLNRFFMRKEDLQGMAGQKREWSEWEDHSAKRMKFSKGSWPGGAGFAKGSKGGKDEKGSGVIFAYAPVGKYSPPASGAVYLVPPQSQARAPEPVSGPRLVDYCSTLELDASASRYTAGQPNVSWRLSGVNCYPPEGEEPDGYCNTTLMELALEDASSALLQIDAAERPPELQSVNIEAVVTNRWGVSASLVVQVNISQVPKPTVDISTSPPSPNPFAGLAMRATIKQSGCVQSPLRFSWRLVSVSASSSATNNASAQALEGRATEMWQSSTGGGQLGIGWNSSNLMFPPLSLAVRDAQRT